MKIKGRMRKNCVWVHVMCLTSPNGNEKGLLGGIFPSSTHSTSHAAKVFFPPPFQWCQERETRNKKEKNTGWGWQRSACTRDSLSFFSFCLFSAGPFHGKLEKFVPNRFPHAFLLPCYTSKRERKRRLSNLLIGAAKVLDHRPLATSGARKKRKEKSRALTFTWCTHRECVRRIDTRTRRAP